jgi:CDP-diacylglycerol pyrophosphatase
MQLAMSIKRPFQFSKVLLLLCMALGLLGHAHATKYSDILLDIVQNCITQDSANYCQKCRAPLAESICESEKSCRKTTQVWSSTEKFVAIRDIKMCGCPADFVHGLVLPKQIITGVEDPLRPDAIWPYAWDIASTRIEPESIALVINPQNFRSQNQMHIHLVRLKPQARTALAKLSNHPIEDLNQVWKTASQLAKEQQLDDFGVIVFRSTSGVFNVVVTAYSPEGVFTQYVCDGS